MGQLSGPKLFSPLQNMELTNEIQFEVSEAHKNTLCSLPKRSVECVTEEGQKDGGWKHYKLGQMEEHLQLWMHLCESKNHYNKCEWMISWADELMGPKG